MAQPSLALGALSAHGALRVFVVTLAVLALAPAQEARAQSPPLAVFTDSQSTRGQQWYEAMCLSCHPTRDMSSADFKLRWDGRTALDLFTRISTTMPQNSPGALSRRAYTDVVTYLMRINGLPSGTSALAADSTLLSQARITFTLPPS